jgi:hypothetical protein
MYVLLLKGHYYEKRCIAKVITGGIRTHFRTTDILKNLLGSQFKELSTLFTSVADPDPGLNK